MFFPKKINQTLLTWFGSGLVPIAPGTAGSIASIPLCWILAQYTPPIFRIFFALGMTAIAILASAQDQMESETKDPSYIVIDETAGMLWSTTFAPAAWLPFLLAFVFFRIFDVLKPFPARWFDRYSKKLSNPIHRGACIVLDDVVAGGYSALLLYGISQYFLL